MASKGMKGLLEWCKRNTQGYQDVRVTNMTTSWKDGLAFCALIHNFRPDLIDFNSLSKENQLYNNELAFTIAENELDIAALLDAEDMATMKVPDKLSVMTYLSQYYNCFRNQKPAELNDSEPAVSNNDYLASKISPKKVIAEESTCTICRKHVHLVQRYFDGGKLYHRTCHRTDSLKNMKALNYFNKKRELEEQKETNKGTGKDSNGTEKVGPPTEEEDGRLPSKRNKEEDLKKEALEIPSLIQTLKETTPEPIKITTTDTSPLVEEAKPLHDPTHAPSLISELPKPKITRDDSYQPQITPPSPRPRARTIHMQYSDEPETNNTPKQPPVATPRSKRESAEKDQEEEFSNEYDSTLNPFEMDSGSDSDTTLSSTSSEDDENNPFLMKNIIAKKPPQPVVPPQPKEEIKKPELKVKEKEPEKPVNLNPFGYVDSDESDHETPNKVDEAPSKVDEAPNEKLDRFNPFSTEYVDEPFVINDKKKKKAPPPPAVKIPSPTRKPLPTSPARKVVPRTPAAPPSPARPVVTSARSVPSPNKTSSPPPAKPLPPTRVKKQPAPPRPLSWKETEKQKMEELNKANDKDPKYAKSQVTSPKSPPQHPKSPLIKPVRPASPKHAPHRREKNPTHPTKPRAAPGYGYPLIKRKVSKKMTEEEISNEIKILDLKLSDLEVKGVKLEEMLRFAMDKDVEWATEEDELLQEWFELVNKKNILLRMETDLVFLMQQQNLEQEHAEIEYELRKIFNKPDSTKTDEDKVEEEKLLKRLVEIVERRNVIVNSIEEERIKEAEEDAAYQQMKRLKDNPNKKKKKHKVKKIFSKRGKKPSKAHETAA